LSVSAGSLPFLHAGSIGPIDLPAAVTARIARAIEAIVARTDLTGLNSLDFLLDGDAFQVLEINARPSSTMTLYETASPNAWPRGLIGCHLDACLEGRLPPPGRPAARARAGQRVVFAPRRFVVPKRLSDACFADTACHDVPQAGARIGHGEPVCTLLVTGATVAAVRDELERREALLLQRIETCHEEPDDVFPSSI
jgi:predicted ATP-grasp superfamily ATP-dependent carboligase